MAWQLGVLLPSLAPKEEETKDLPVERFGSGLADSYDCKVWLNGQLLPPVQPKYISIRKCSGFKNYN